MVRVAISIIVLAGLWLGGGTALPGCAPPTDDDSAGTAPIRQPGPPGVVMNRDRVREIKRHHDETLMAIDGVEGTGISAGSAGTPVIEVYVARLTDELTARIPKQLDGVPVRVVETGPFSAR